jgi:hypothetical protein
MACLFAIYLVFALPFVFGAPILHAQQLSLQLDQTINIPQGTTLWDVMPHRDGSYYWLTVQSDNPASSRVTWGNASSRIFDTLRINVTGATYVTGFFREDYVPHFALGSLIHGTQMEPPCVTSRDTLKIGVYSLIDGSQEGSIWRWACVCNVDNYSHSYTSDLVVRHIEPIPPPPGISHAVAAVINYYYYLWGSGDGIDVIYSRNPGILVRNLLPDAGNLTLALGQGSSATATQWNGRTFIATGGGAEDYSAYHGNGGMHYWKGFGMYEVTTDSILPRFGHAIHSIHPIPLSRVPYAAYDVSNNRPVVIEKVGSAHLEARIAGRSDSIWAVDRTYGAIIAASADVHGAREQLLASTVPRLDLTS